MKNEEQRFTTLPAEELPPGWTLTTIGKMVDTDGVFTDGDWVVSKDQDPDGDVRLIQLADIGDGFWVNKSSRYLTYEKAIELGCTFLEPGDVLIARMPDPLGRACIFPGDPKRCITAVDVCIVRTGGQGISHRWLMHTINSPAARVLIESLQSGSTRKRISRKNLGRIDFPLPPSPEQRRIVAEIETQFTRLDAGVAALERAQANLKRYRASVLKAACEGRLVPTEAELHRRSAVTTPLPYEPADQLLARILAERRARWEAEHPGKKYKEPAPPDAEGLSELPEGWVWTSIEQMGDVIGGLTKNAKRKAYPAQLPYLRVANVYADELRLDDVQRIGVKATELERVLLQQGDLLVVEGNGSIDQIGRVAIWNGSIAPCVHQNHIIKVRFHLVEIAKYVLSWLLSLGGRGQIIHVASSTSGLYTLSISKVSALPIPLPPLAEQRRIVSEVERRLSVMAALEAEVEAALARATRLRQSILKRAFEGRLVEQDPNDEPAAALLARIQAEKTHRGAARQSKKTSRRSEESRAV